MSIWNKLIESVGGIVSAYVNEEVTRDASKYALVDCEVGMKDKRVHDIGALRWDGAKELCYLFLWQITSKLNLILIITDYQYIRHICIRILIV